MIRALVLIVLSALKCGRMDKPTQIPTKAQLLARPEIGSETALANLLGISRSAVNQWDDDKSIPERRWLKLRYEKAPHLFDTPNG